MSTINKTYKELQRFDNLATNYLIDNGYFEVDPETRKGKYTDKATKEPNKFITNMKSVIKQWGKIFEEYKEKINDIQIDFCSVDEKSKVILYNPNGSYQFTKEKVKECNKKLKELADEKVAVYQRITLGENIPTNLTEEELEAFGGLIIPEQVSEEA